MSKPQPANAPGARGARGALCADRTDRAAARGGPLRRRRARAVPLPSAGPHRPTEVSRWVDEVATSTERLYHAVIDRETRGAPRAAFALMGLVPENGVIEFGAVYWGPKRSRGRAAPPRRSTWTARHIFETLGNRRFEWKCNNLNEPSKRAAIRFGFTCEGLFRQHMIFKGENRDTAWFAMLDSEWAGDPGRIRALAGPGEFCARRHAERRR